LQRAVDQIIHDTAIMNLPVRFLVDRAGIVGSDGETHHGLFDIALLKSIPNLMILAPADGAELRDMIHFAAKYDKGPLAIRYPRGGMPPGMKLSEAYKSFVPGKIGVLRKGKDIAILALGDMVQTAIALGDLLSAGGISPCVINIRSIKPLDLEGIEKELARVPFFITLENACVTGGVGEYIVSSIDRNLRQKCLFTAGFPDRFITHGSNTELFRFYGLDPESLYDSIRPHFKVRKSNEKGQKARPLPRRK
jgi:1-deoxy-D-xylulose-5-phosphate synthase